MRNGNNITSSPPLPHTLSQTLGYIGLPISSHDPQDTGRNHSLYYHRKSGKSPNHTHASQPEWGTGDGPFRSLQWATIALVGWAAYTIGSVALITLSAMGARGCATQLSSTTRDSKELYGHVATKFA